MSLPVAVVSLAHTNAYGYVHALSSLEIAELVGVIDQEARRARTVASQFDIPWGQSFEEVLEWGAEAVVLCSETGARAHHIETFSKQGLHLLCETPLGLTVEGARKSLDLCRDAGVTLQIARPLRFHPAAQYLRQSVAAGQLGDLVAIEGVNRTKQPDSWMLEPGRSGGGALLNNGTALVDLVCWATGLSIEGVYAELASNRPELQVEDSALVSLDVEGGAISTLDLSWSRPASYSKWGDVTLELIGTQAMLSADLSSQALQVVTDSDFGSTQVGWGDDLQLLVARSFVESLLAAEGPNTDNRAELEAMRIIDAAYRSAENATSVRV